MRTLMLCQHFPALSETFVIDQVRGLRDLLVGIVAATVDSDLLQRTPDLPPVRALEPAYPPAGLGQAPWLKARWFLQRRRAAHRFGWSPDVQGRLLESIHHFDPEMIFIQYGTIAAWGYPALERSGRPFVVHFHGVDASASLRSQSYRECLAELLPRAHDVIVVSSAMRDRLAEIAPRARFHVNPCGVAVPEQAPPRDPSSDRCRLLMVGRLVEKKAPLLSLQAVAKAARQTSVPLSVDVMGDGPLLDEVKAFIEEHRGSLTARLHGPVSHDQVLAQMMSSDVFLQHSVVAPNGDREGSPVAVMESAAMGLPVVATRHEGIVESVADGETGILLDEHDVDAMAAAIVRLAEDPSLRERMGRQAHRRAHENFRAEQRIGTLRRCLLGDGG